MTMKLRLQQAIQENEYYFRGFVRMADLAELFREYPFEEETLEKAAIHRRSMEHGISSFTVTLRAMPDTRQRLRFFFSQRKKWKIWSRTVSDRINKRKM